MTRQVSILKAGPGITCQDRGRPGYLAYGLSRGGAADILALSEGAALAAGFRGALAEPRGGLTELGFCEFQWIPM